MSGWTQADVDRINARRRRPGDAPPPAPADVPKEKRSKYRNVRTHIDGKVFDSKREADYYLLLKAREQAGEIKQLRCQPEFPLLAPVAMNSEPMFAGETLKDALGFVEVARYRADFTYRDADTNTLHVVDAKGLRTKEYRLKAKWMLLQYAITIEEV